MVQNIVHKNLSGSAFLKSTLAWGGEFPSNALRFVRM